MITSPTGKIYIGQSIDIERRFQTYRGIYYPKSQRKLYASLNKYGPANHKFEILKECDKSDLNALEKEYISIYKSFGTRHGMNLKSHSERGCTLSQETKNKISKSNTGKRHGPRGPRPDHIRKKISQSHIGLVTRIGFKVPQEVRDRISKKLKGIKFSLERRENIRNGVLNIPRRNVIQLDKDGNKIKVWPSMSAAARGINGDPSAIRKVCIGLFNMHKKFKWAYA